MEILCFTADGREEKIDLTAKLGTRLRNFTCGLVLNADQMFPELLDIDAGGVVNFIVTRDVGQA